MVTYSHACPKNTRGAHHCPAPHKRGHIAGFCSLVRHSLPLPPLHSHSQSLPVSFPCRSLSVRCASASASALASHATGPRRRRPRHRRRRRVAAVARRALRGPGRCLGRLAARPPPLLPGPLGGGRSGRRGGAAAGRPGRRAGGGSVHRWAAATATPRTLVGYARAMQVCIVTMHMLDI